MGHIGHNMQKVERRIHAKRSKWELRDSDHNTALNILHSRLKLYAM